MESRSTFARSLVICGTACVLASLAVLAYAIHLSSADAQDHRRQVVTLFDRPGVSRVHLARWEPPGIALAWCGLAGGFVLSGVGMGIGLRTARMSGLSTKSPAFSDY
jgi:hypothetical protein